MSNKYDPAYKLEVCQAVESGTATVAEMSHETGDWLFIGRCKFSKKKLVVTIFNNEKEFLSDSIKTLTFISKPISE